MRTVNLQNTPAVSSRWSMKYTRSCALDDDATPNRITTDEALVFIAQVELYRLYFVS